MKYNTDGLENYLVYINLCFFNRIENILHDSYFFFSHYIIAYLFLYDNFFVHLDIYLKQNLKFELQSFVQIIMKMSAFIF